MSDQGDRGPAAELRGGVVVEFDAGRGLGEIEADGIRFPFHCTQIADGTRTIEVGVVVHFAVAAGLLGRWEASHVVKA